MLQCDELKDDERPSNTLELFTEREQVQEMIENLKGCDDPGFEKDFEQYTEILNRYQEQPHLLDTHLEDLLNRLLNKIRNRSLSENQLHAAFKYMYIICKVRTYKALVKFLPHELSDLEYALELLERQDPKQYANWETRYMLICWMSFLVLNPFHMSRLDAYNVAATANNECDNVPSKSKMQRIYELCQLYSSTNDTCSAIAAQLAAKYFIRSDIKDIYLENFLEWVISQNQADTVNVKYGQLAAVAAILKHGKREDLLPYAERLLRWIMNCQYKQDADFLKYKYFIKIVQRLGLIYLKPRLALWRYKRGTRSLATNLQQDISENVPNSKPTSSQNATEEEEVVVPDAVEEVLEELLQALRSGSCDIRWSAAKGVGRVTNRLNKELADEVIGSVIDILNPLEPHEAWHGGCLALAELAKRGLLLPYRLRNLVDLLQQALFYDEMKGYMSVGQHIRDAACYMCWAFARAYNPEDLQPFVQEIAAGLLTVATFDREINCRRAASAAFQESVGRLGNFPHGIDISTTTDFYSVGLRQNSYLNISNFIAQYDEYCQTLIRHLIERKVGHWDVAIRELTAKALNKLTSRDPPFMSDIVLPQLFIKLDSIDINARHGAILALGEITLAIQQLDHIITRQMIEQLNCIMGKLLQRDLFRGMAGELMKQCCCDFIRNCSLAQLPATEQCLQDWQQIIDKSIINKAAPIRESATAAFTQLCRTYYSDTRLNANEKIVNAYILGSSNDLEEHIRMGYTSLLGALPLNIVSVHFERLLDCLVQHSLTPLQAIKSGEVAAMVQEHTQTANWSEARRECVKALVNLVRTVGFDVHQKVSFGHDKYFNKLLDCLLRCLDEYTLDNRGDIGAWVREAAITALHEILTKCPSQILKPDQVHKIMLGFAQQAVEKIDRTRGLAGRSFCNLVHHTPTVPHIREHEKLKELFPRDDSEVLWLFADHTFPLFCALLEFPDYSQRVLLGLTASVGQLTESLIKHSANALFRFLRSQPTHVPRICREIVLNFEQNLLNERITYPMLSFLEKLIGSCTINDVLLDPENPFAEDIFRLLNLEIKGHKKLYKLVSSINVYCQLVQVPQLCKRILSKLAVFLGLTHVHVRKSTAIKLCEALLLYGDCCDIPQENLDDIMNLLSETDWGAPLVEVRPIRNEICNMLGIKPPVSNMQPTTSAGAVNNNIINNCSENATTNERIAT